MYLLLKHLHVSCVVLSGLGFVLRGYWKFRRPEALAHPWVRRAPHLVDTLLLGSALALAWISGQYPFVLPWLTAKVLALLAYIVLGSLALKRATTLGGQLLCFFLALLTLAYIVSVALTRQPMPWLA